MDDHKTDAIQTHKSYCRFCHAYCALEVDVEGGKVVAVRGDPSDPVYGGYTCEKGRELPSESPEAEEGFRCII